MVDDAHRLPRAVEPQRYDITLTPDLAAATFAGEERVRCLVHQPVNAIVLNAAELAIVEAEFVSDDGLELPGTVALDEASQRATIALAETATPGHWTLRLAFTGILNDRLRGFYRSTFTDDDGNEQVIATTQFESTDARRAFPCWDEPDRKAVFAITLVVDEDAFAVSNAAVVEDRALGTGKRQVRFADTIRMSTYLVAFAVGPFEATDPVDVDGVPLRVITPPGKLDLTGFALEIGAHSLRFFTSYFGLPYPGDKLDLIAIPDFAFGAMENLGAVTFRETALLADPDLASRPDLERVADVVAHEIAHMWFGDLVTMSWWNGIWLNEAFATFMEMLCVDAFRPQWRRWATFGTERSRAMQVDALASTRPVEYPVETPEEAEGMFDVLTYQKGAGVLRMLERYLGAEEFRRGIAQYLTKHSYANAETTDLWDALEDATGEPVRSIMDTWIFQGGYPIVRAERVGSAITMEQRQFRLRGEGDGTWQVPVLVRSPDGHDRQLLTTSTATMKAADWVVVNDGGSGFFRVEYADDLLAPLLDGRAALDPVERFNLVSDTWASALAGRVPAATFIGVVERLAAGGENDPNVWKAMLDPFELLDRVVDDARRAALQALVRSLAGPRFAELGWSPASGEGEDTSKLRATVLEPLGTIGADPDVRAEALARHARYLEDRTALHPDLAPAVITIVAGAGGEAEFSEFLDRYRHPSTPQEEMRYLTALARFPSAPLVRRALELMLSDEVRTQNAPFAINAAFRNRDHGGLTWEFVRDRWPDLTSRFPGKLLDRMVTHLPLVCRPEIAIEARDFFGRHPVPASERQIDQILEELDTNVAFRQREADRLLG